MCWHSQTLGNFNYSMMVLCSIFSICVLNMFCYCYYGGRTTQQFMDMADTVFESKWNHLPINLQKFIFLMIINAQKSIFYHGFYVVDLKLTTFTRVSLFPWNLRIFHANVFMDRNICRHSKRSSAFIWCSKDWHWNEIIIDYRFRNQFSWIQLICSLSMQNGTQLFLLHWLCEHRTHDSYDMCIALIALYVVWSCLIAWVEMLSVICEILTSISLKTYNLEKNDAKIYTS